MVSLVGHIRVEVEIVIEVLVRSGARRPRFSGRLLRDRRLVRGAPVAVEGNTKIAEVSLGLAKLGVQVGRLWPETTKFAAGHAAQASEAPRSHAQAEYMTPLFSRPFCLPAPLAPTRLPAGKVVKGNHETPLVLALGGAGPPAAEAATRPQRRLVEGRWARDWPHCARVVGTRWLKVLRGSWARRSAAHGAGTGGDEAQELQTEPGPIHAAAPVRAKPCAFERGAP